MNKLVRFAAGVALCGIALLHGTSALSQNYPARQLRMLVSHPPGSVGDVLGRMLGQKLSESFGQAVVVENRVGASQMIAADAAAKSAPDGHTLFLGSTTSLAMNVSTQKKMPYDPVRDFAPVTLALYTPLVLVVNPRLGARSIKELIAIAKARPGQLTFGAAGHGTTAHLSGEMLKTRAGIDMLFVPYKGSSLPALIGGHLDMAFEGMVAAEAAIKSGQLIALALTSGKRVAFAPGIPVMAEDLPGYQANFWIGVVVPAGTPRPIVNRLNEQTNAILRTQEMKDRFHPLGGDLAGTTPEEFAALIKAEIQQWAKVLREAGISPE
jgi:tripartite-type tricarboxylate transporter receptor subunit TctC